MSAATSKQIAQEVLSWPGVTAEPHRFQGVQFNLGRRQLGHLHGQSTADIPLLRTLKRELLASGRVRQHRWRPESGWVTVPIDSDAGRAEALRLLRLGYESAQRARERDPIRNATP